MVRQEPAKLPFPSSNLGATSNLKFSVLYLVSTPIGNLADLTYRAVEVLSRCDYILCEDTRHSRVLLDHYAINTPLRAFHRFNESRSSDGVIADLKEGKSIALISDAGTPLLADPGQDIVQRCRQEGLPVTAIPGPCAVIDAWVLSGFAEAPFQFIGFLPKKEMELQTILAHAMVYPGTTIAYETPHRIVETLEMINNLSPERQLCVARELTKLHEECLIGTAKEILARLQTRGEMVLLISAPKENILFSNLSLTELVEMLQNDLHLSKSEAIKMAAQLRQVPKREVYNKFFRNND